MFPALQDNNYHVSVFVAGWGGAGVGASGGMGGVTGVSVGGGQLGGKGGWSIFNMYYFISFHHCCVFFGVVVVSF